MRYIKSYKIFEGRTKKVTEPEIKTPEQEQEEKDVEVLMGKFLHLYGSIPITKDKAAIVIPKILSKVAPGFPFQLGSTIKLNEITDFKTRLRLLDYFDSILQFKETRGHNFEGLIAGLYGGTLATSKTSKADVFISSGKATEGISVKFIDKKGKAPEIGSFKDIFDKGSSNKILFSGNSGEMIELPIKDYVVQQGGLTRIFQNDPQKYNYDYLKNPEIWTATKDQIVSFIFNSSSMKAVSKLLIAYTSIELSDVEDDPLKNLDKINLDIISVENLKNLILSGYVVSPKGGKDSHFSLALSTKYREPWSEPRYTKSEIFLPRKITKPEFIMHFDIGKEQQWMSDVFGKDVSGKIRPDVLNHIRNNRKHIITRLTEWDRIWNQTT